MELIPHYVLQTNEALSLSCPDVSALTCRQLQGYLQHHQSQLGAWRHLFMAALWNRAGHYIFMLWFLSIFLSIFFFFSPNLSCRRLDVCHTSTHGVALMRI